MLPLPCQALVVREPSVEVSTGPAAAAAAAAAAASGGVTLPIAVPGRSQLSADGGPGGLMQMAGSAGAGPSPLGTSPAMGGPSPGLMPGSAEEMHAGMVAASQGLGAPGAAVVRGGADCCCVLACACRPGPCCGHCLAPGRQGARGVTCLVAVALQAPAAAAAVGVTTQAAVQVAQAAQAVSQQAASLHAAAEVHAAKAHAATSQVQSLHATAQVRPRHTLLTWQAAEGVLWTRHARLQEFLSACCNPQPRSLSFPPCLFPCCPSLPPGDCADA